MLASIKPRFKNDRLLENTDSRVLVVFRRSRDKSWADESERSLCLINDIVLLHSALRVNTEKRSLCLSVCGQTTKFHI